jgi:hypothetical protein
MPVFHCNAGPVAPLDGCQLRGRSAGVVRNLKSKPIAIDISEAPVGAVLEPFFGSKTVRPTSLQVEFGMSLNKGNRNNQNTTLSFVGDTVCVCV